MKGAEPGRSGSTEASIAFMLNGKRQEAPAALARMTLLDYLRDELRLRGTKEGCAEGDCGACIVAARDGGDTRFVAVNACQQLLGTVHGRQVVTIEGLGEVDCAGTAPRLHPVQRAMLDAGASQCGFCTPGIVMSLASLFDSNPRPDDQTLRHALAGNLCRCTGYRPILAAARALADADVPVPLSKGAHAPEERVAFDTLEFASPTSLAELHERLAAAPGAWLLAGGTELITRLSRSQRGIPPLIYLGRVADLQVVERHDDHIRIGAAASLGRAFPVLLDEYPALDEVCRRFASLPVCNRATLGGNLASGSPVADMIPVLMVLDARITIGSATGERDLAVEDLYAGYRSTCLQPGEYIRSIRIPRREPGQVVAAYKVSKRFEQDTSTVLACFSLRLQDGRVRGARVCYAGMSAQPPSRPACGTGAGGYPSRSVERGSSAGSPRARLRADIRSSWKRGVSKRRRREPHHQARLRPSLRRAGPDLERGRMTLPESPHGSALNNMSAELHVSGRALYTDDLPEVEGTLFAAIGTSPVAHARLASLDLGPVRAASGVVAVLTSDDLPGPNSFAPDALDDPIFAAGEVLYAGQSVFVVVAHSLGQARRAARLARFEFEPRPAVIDIHDAIVEGTYLDEPSVLKRGDVDAALREAPHNLRGRIRTGGQDHFYLEGQVALAVPEEGGLMRVVCSSQNPSEVQRMVARVLQVDESQVLARCGRLGGGFGGKETQPALFACIAALAARKTGRPVKLRMRRDQDMAVTGKRHDFVVDYRVAFGDGGRIEGLELDLAVRCGSSRDLSLPVTIRALLHCDNCYFLENVRLRARRFMTHTASNTAFRGFGAPQAVLAIENVIDEVARYLDLDPVLVRRRNFYAGPGRDTTHYGMQVEDNILGRLVDELGCSADYAARVAQLEAFNRGSGVLKRGIAMVQ